MRRLPAGVAERLRGVGTAPEGSLSRRARIALLSCARRGGIPAGVHTFRLDARRELSFVNAPSLVLEQLYWLGEFGWEPELMRWWRQFCGQCEVIVELGANVGYYTVQGAKAAPRARYIAVEPHPASVEVCRANLDLNGVTNVTLVAAAAVADGSTSVPITVPAEQLATPTVAYVSADGELPPDMTRGPHRRIEVPAVDVRDLVTGADLVKLDVEGQEHALLAAVRDELVRRRPTLFVELLPGTPELRKVLRDLCDAGGYRCYAPRLDRLVEIEPARIPSVRLQTQYATNDVILSADPTFPTLPPTRL